MIELNLDTLAREEQELQFERFIENRYGLSPVDHASDGGGYPLRLCGLGVIGAITVSGMPSADDHRLVTTALPAFLAG